MGVESTDVVPSAHLRLIYRKVSRKCRVVIKLLIIKVKMLKTKHYSAVEKKIFLEILKDFKHVIEVKKSDSSTLRDKDVAWSEICKRYNDCTTIAQERTVALLKKLWANMKQSQREVLTKERQARLATGGGPPPSETNIDPDIALITPHLLKTAPVLFSSNMPESDINDNEERVINALKDYDVTTISCDNSNDADMTRNAEVIGEIDITNEDIEETSNKENQNPFECNEAFPTKRKEKWDIAGTRAPKLMKGKKSTHTFTSEEDIKIERIQHIIDHEEEIAKIRKAHEEKLTEMKQDLHALEVRAALAKAELAELQLRKEKERLEKRE